MSSRSSAPTSTRQATHALHGSTLGLVVGLLGLVYGAQGVTQTAQLAMATVWNIPQIDRTGFLPRLGRSLAGLITIGVAFFVNAFVTDLRYRGYLQLRDQDSGAGRTAGASTARSTSPPSPC